MRTRIGIFGGAFNPIHNGHLAVVRSFLESLLIHEVWILPTPDPPHKSAVDLVPFKHRLKMLEIAFEEWERVKISTLEMSLPYPSYTVTTVEYLQNSYPKNLFYLCIGEDSLVHFHTWHEYQSLLSKICLLVARRPEYSIQKVSGKILERTLFAEHHPRSISSSAIRAANMEGTEQKDPGKRRSERLKQVPEEVRHYITSNHLYA